MTEQLKMERYYCCKKIKELDEKKIIDYCPPNLTTLDVKRKAYPIYFCPFCGKKIKGSKEFVRRLKRQVKGLRLKEEAGE